MYLCQIVFLRKEDGSNFDILDCKPFVLSVSRGAKKLDKRVCHYTSVSQKTEPSKLIDCLAAGLEVIEANPDFSCFFHLHAFCTVHWLSHSNTGQYFWTISDCSFRNKNPKQGRFCSAAFSESILV